MLEVIFGYEFWQIAVFENSVKDYATAVFAFLGLLLFLHLLQSLLLAKFSKIAQKTKTDIDDAIITITRTVRPPFYSFIAFYLALNFLFIHDFARKVVNVVLVLWIVYQVVVALQILVDFITKKIIKKESEKGSKEAIELVSKLAKGALWGVGLLFVLSNLGINITSLVAGLGVGGIAIAFALQSILGDLFSSFAILFDKPFVAGDFIIVGDKMGVVEKIGIKTTRIKALQGEEIIISNNELTSTQIQNFKKMRERRVIFTFGVLYETPQVKLKQIPKIVEKIIKSVKLTRFDRAHFYKFDDSALSFEVVYYIKDSSYNKYMDINEQVLFKINETFKGLGISMAYPTRTLYLEDLNHPVIKK